jgi:hypothetical protein
MALLIIKVRPLVEIIIDKAITILRMLPPPRQAKFSSLKATKTALQESDYIPLSNIIKETQKKKENESLQLVFPSLAITSSNILTCGN